MVRVVEVFNLFVTFVEGHFPIYGDTLNPMKLQDLQQRLSVEDMGEREMRTFWSSGCMEVNSEKMSPCRIRETCSVGSALVSGKTGRPSSKVTSSTSSRLR